MKTLENNVIKREILKFLEEKGALKAALYNKVKKKALKLNFDISLVDTALLELLWERKIEIIIPQIIKSIWIKKNLDNTSYIARNKEYFVRKCLKRENVEYPTRDNKYYNFDSRTLNFDDNSIKGSIKKYLKEMFKKYPSNIIIFKPINSEPLSMYESLDKVIFLEDFKEDQAMNYFQNKNKEIFKIEIPLIDQIEGIGIFKNFKEKHACTFITIIETIHNIITNLQGKNQEINNEVLEDYIKKFVFYCELFIRSDWIDTSSLNFLKWESFFSVFKVPIKIYKLKIKSIKFIGKIFITLNNVQFGLSVSSQQEINFLKNFGYQELNDLEIKGEKIMGLDFEFMIPCPSIEYYYFIAKYVLYYHLFLLFYNSFEIINKDRKYLAFTQKERLIFKEFLPIIKVFFEIEDKKVSKKLAFKHYTVNFEELEILYNYFLMTKIKNLEKTLARYMLLKNLKKASRSLESSRKTQPKHLNIETTYY
ncbi:MAG: hypothetical protein ACTSYC_09800 [Promethearchaeota archaeon]